MIRVVLSRIPAGGRFQRFWVPSLDQIEASVRTHGHGIPEINSSNVTELIRRVRVGDINKSTAPARLGAADTALLSQVEGQSFRDFQFLDVGCSDGTTSIDTVEKLERALRIPIHAYVMDRYIWVRRRSRFPFVEYLTSEGGLVMARWGIFALCQAPRSFLLAGLTNRLVSAYLGFTGFRERMLEAPPFPLLSPRVLSRPDVRIIEGSVLSPRPDLLGRMDAVRVSNLLHYDYFSRNELVAGLSTVAACLRDGGLLVVSRNQAVGNAEIERGTIWRRVGSSLVRAVDFGGGSELTDLVESSDLLGLGGATRA